MGVSAGVVLGQARGEIGGESGIVVRGVGDGLEDVDVVEGCHGGIVARGRGAVGAAGRLRSRGLSYGVANLKGQPPKGLAF